MYWLVLSSYEAQIPPLTCRHGRGAQRSHKEVPWLVLVDIGLGIVKPAGESVVDEGLGNNHKYFHGNYFNPSLDISWIMQKNVEIEAIAMIQSTP